MGYKDKLGNMVLVSSVLKNILEEVKQDDSIVLFALKNALEKFSSFEYTEEQQGEIDSLMTTVKVMSEVDLKQVLFEQAFSTGDMAKGQEIMATLDDKQAEHDSKLADMVSRLSALQSSAQTLAEETFSQVMSGRKSGPKGPQIDYPHVGIVVRCPYDRGKKSVFVVVEDENTWRVWCAKNGSGKVIEYNSDEHDDSPTITSLSMVRKVADCFHKDLVFSADNLKKQTLGVGDTIEADPPGSKGGTYAMIVSQNVKAWESEQRKHNSKVAAQAKDTEKKNHG